MPVTLTAALLTAANPRPVQVTLTGTTAGQAYEIRGTSGDGSSWPVPGGRGVSTGTQVIVIDNRAALNVPIIYTVVVAGATVTAAPVTVAWGGVGVLQMLNGKGIVPIEVASITEKRKRGTRASVFEVAGRVAPAARLDVPGSVEFDWELETQAQDTAAMVRILSSGAPVVRRLTPGMRDLQSVVIGIVLSWSDELITVGGDTWRRFTLAVREVGDPQPSAALAAYMWGDVDTAMAKPRTWSYHSTLQTAAGLTTVNGSLSVQSTGGYPDGAGTSFGRLTVSAAAAASVFESVFTAAQVTLGAPVGVGSVITVAMRVKGTPGRTVNAAVKWSGGAIAAGTPIALTGAWQMVSVTATAPAGTTGAAYGWQLAPAGVAAGNQVDFDAVTISQGPTVPVGTFDEMFTTWDQFDAADWAQWM